MPPCAAPPPAAWRWCAAAGSCAQLVLRAHPFRLLEPGRIEQYFLRSRQRPQFFLSEAVRRDATRRPWTHDHPVRLLALRPRANRVQLKHVWPAALPARVRWEIFLLLAEALDSLPLSARFSQLPDGL